MTRPSSTSRSRRKRRRVEAFFQRGQADLSSFFLFHPWLYLFLVPAIAMRLWAEERRAGTIELLMTLPVSPWALVVGKWLAAWVFAGLALVLVASALGWATFTRQQAAQRRLDQVRIETRFVGPAYVPLLPIACERDQPPLERAIARA